MYRKSLGDVTETTAFEVSLEMRGPVPVIRVSGDIDLATVPALERALLRAISSSAETVIDLSECTFIDASGIETILRAQRLLRARIGPDPKLRLVVGERGPSRTLRLAGFEEITELCSSLAEAMAIAAGRPAAETLAG